MCRLFLCVALLTLVLLGLTSASPGHMQHKYYQDQERQRQRGQRQAPWGEHRSGADLGPAGHAMVVLLTIVCGRLI